MPATATMTMALTDQLDPLLRAAGYHRVTEVHSQYCPESQYSRDGIDLIFTHSTDLDNSEWWTIQAYVQDTPGQDPDEWPGILEARIHNAEQAITYLVAANLLPAGITTAMRSDP